MTHPLNFDYDWNDEIGLGQKPTINADDPEFADMRFVSPDFVKEVEALIKAPSVGLYTFIADNNLQDDTPELVAQLFDDGWSDAESAYNFIAHQSGARL